jgi:uncharacterized Zn ribbon protein
MIMKAALLVLALGSVMAYGQDDAAQQAMQAAQMASQQAIAASQQAMDQATIASQQATINMQQAMANASSSSSCPGPIIGMASQPTFSVKKGKVAAGTQVRIKSATHYAAIYYTTDGWAPSKDSTHYTGPITINADSHLQAIAYGPNLLPSSIARIDYTVDAAAIAPPQPAPLTTDGILHAKTALRLVTSTEVSSQTAEVGDKIPLLLDQDVKAGDAVVIPKGTPVDGILVVADPANKRIGPGDMVFEVRSLIVQGKTVPLSGGETVEGEPGRNPKDAMIEPGMVVTVWVTADTPLKQ